jgi:sorbitol-specific phosphotransferase system component IIBC
MNAKKDERICMTSKERQTTETVQAKKDKQQIQAKKDKQKKQKSWLLRLVEKIGTGELGPSSPPPIYMVLIFNVGCLA